MDVYTVQPHAHYLAREATGFAILPDGTRKSLIDIRAWDFNWQGVYRYASPVFLPAGSTITMEYVYESDDRSRQPDTAVRLAERAAALTSPQTARVLDVLAAALAGSGQFERAVTTCEAALAKSAGAESAAIRRRLQMYRERRPYRE